MICKFCNAEIEDGLTVCPECNQLLSENADLETAVNEEEIQAEPEDEVAALKKALADREKELSDLQEELAERDEQEKEKKKRRDQWLPAKIAGFVVAMGALAVLLLLAMGVDLSLPENDIFRKDAYTATEEKALKAADKVIATMGDAELTNAELEIYYRMQVLDFVNYYGSYLSQIGLDTTQPLSEQTCYYDSTMTWEQYFIEIAIETWQNYQALGQRAEASGFTLDEEWEEELAKIPETLQTQATEAGFETVEQLLKDRLGPGCTEETYMSYVRLNALGNEYYSNEYEKMLPTDEEIETYYTDNQAAFEANGIVKDDGITSSVRHILVMPEGGTVSEDGYTTTYSDEEWAACLKKAEEILDEWKAGAATEESFAELVPVYSEDSGSLETGGLYEGITPTSSYVENFLNWAIDEARVSGETGIVQTEYGYHVMYFVERVQGEPQWIQQTRTQLMSERATEMVEEAKEAYPMEVQYKKIVLGPLEMA